jgi:hypothetical protein
MKLATHFHLEQRLRRSRAILPLYPFDGVDRKNYYLYLLLALPSVIIFSENRTAKILFVLLSQL